MQATQYQLQQQQLPQKAIEHQPNVDHDQEQQQVALQSQQVVPLTGTTAEPPAIPPHQDLPIASHYVPEKVSPRKPAAPPEIRPRVDSKLTQPKQPPQQPPSGMRPEVKPKPIIKNVTSAKKDPSGSGHGPPPQQPTSLDSGSTVPPYQQFYGPGYEDQPPPPPPHAYELQQQQYRRPEYPCV